MVKKSWLSKIYVESSNTNRVMKTYISPEMRLIELGSVQGVMNLTVVSGQKADKNVTVLTKRNVWDNDEDDDEW